MADVPRNPSQNRLLSRLTPEEFTRLDRQLQPVELKLRSVIHQPNSPVRHVYFPEEGMISVVAQMENGSSIEVATIGKEGVAGAIILLEADALPYLSIVQVAGRARRIEADLLREAASRNGNLHRQVLRFYAALLVQTMQMVACNGLHSVQQRCCRWLLMAGDRSASQGFELTHEFLALMLGVRRASVSQVLQPLQEDGLIGSHRGMITILDRERLEARSCDCYRLIADQQRRLLAADRNGA